MNANQDNWYQIINAAILDVPPDACVNMYACMHVCVNIHNICVCICVYVCVSESMSVAVGFTLTDINDYYLCHTQVYNRQRYSSRFCKNVLLWALYKAMLFDIYSCVALNVIY